MAKDYFADIDTSEARRRSVPETVQDAQEQTGAEKSIRNISVSPRRSAMTQRMADPRLQQKPAEDLPRRTGPRFRSRLILWIGALLALVAVAGVVFVVLTAETTVEITPRTHTITFDPSTQFSAQPVGETATGIVYSTKSFDLDESSTVPATGTEKAEDRASGTITVYNAYSASPVRLIKNTRFESPNGLVYRIPASIEVPGKKGATPGETTVTVFADQAGPQYNIGATDKFTVPGLKGTPDMYNGVYGRSSQPFTGGFLGDKPAVTPSALETARTDIRARLNTKVQEQIAAITEGFAFASLAQIQYESLPTVADLSGGAKITERAHVVVPIFPADSFAKAIAEAVSADAADNKVSLKPQGLLTAQIAGTAPQNLGANPFAFTLTGGALVVWDVDVEAVKRALAGKDKSAFKQIVSTFLGIKDARANVAPRWSSMFPANPEDIAVTVVNPAQNQ